MAFSVENNGWNNTNNNSSLFKKLDKNNDGKITKIELFNAGYDQKEIPGMWQVIFFAEREVNKWFTLDKNKDGYMDNIEMAMWALHNNNPDGIIEDMTIEQFAERFNKVLDGYSYGDMKQFCNGLLADKTDPGGLNADAKRFMGRELTDEETQLLYDVMKLQMNRWLFKNDALYNNLSCDSYTRLATTEQTISCCGGNIDKPPMGPQNPNEGCAMIFSSIQKINDINTADEVKNRLAWAMFRTMPQEQVRRMTPERYAHYQQQWQAVRGLKASDFRAMLNDENTETRKKFEENSLMSVRQIVEYIDIVEKVIGKNFDSDDWEINGEQMQEILEHVNGNIGEENLLNGKTRADVPPEKQALLKYLEENNLLLEQFK